MDELLNYLEARSSACRSLVELRYLNQHSDAQVAEALGLNTDEYEETRRVAREMIVEYYASKLR